MTITNRMIYTYPILSTNKMKLIYNKEVDILHVLSLLPPPREHIPVLRGTHNHITLQSCAGSKLKYNVESI